MVDVVNQLTRHELRHDLSREPTAEELAAHRRIIPEEVRKIQRYAREPISLTDLVKSNCSATRSRGERRGEDLRTGFDGWRVPL